MLQCFILPKNIHLGPYEELILNLEIQYNSFGRYDVNGEINWPIFHALSALGAMARVKFIAINT